MKKDPINLGLILAFAVSIFVITGQGFMLPRLDGVGLAVFHLLPTVFLQLAFCRGSWKMPVKLLPMAACGLLFLWGLWLYLTSDSWMNAELIDLLRDYGLPFVGCCLSWFAYALYLRKKA